MSGELCPDCVDRPNLGNPSYARWVGPDGGHYCSLHFITRFGHGEKLIRLEGYEPPPFPDQGLPEPEVAPPPPPPAETTEVPA